MRGLYALLVLFLLAAGCSSPDSGASTHPLFPDTWQGLHLFVYGGGLAGKVGVHLEEEQLRETARRFDAALWLYSDTGVAQILKEENPQFLTFLYYDAIYSGLYETREGIYWMPREDWEFVSRYPSMFARNCRYSKEPHCRLRNPIWRDEWLMDVSDLDEEDADDITHWVNYLAHITDRRIREDGYIDGVFFDELMLPYTPYMPESMPHYGAWFNQLKRAAAFLRKYHKNRPLLFNGLQQDFLFYPDIVELLNYTDGALFECFVLCWAMGPYMGEYIWKRTLELALELETQGKAQFLQAIWTAGDIPRGYRLLALASYYLVKGHRTYFYLNVLDRQQAPLFLPEWELDLGEPLYAPSTLDSLRSSEGYYTREYTNGKVFVNPFFDKSFQVHLSEECARVLPAGTGYISTQGRVVPYEDWKLDLETVTVLTLEPATGEILLCPPPSGASGG